MVAAISIVCHVRRIFKLTRFDELVPEAQLAGEIGGLLAIVLRKARGKGGYREGAFTQRRMRCPSEISRVSSPRERNQQGVERTERSKQPMLLFERRSFVRLSANARRCDRNEVLRHEISITVGGDY